ncbi:unnamed protein product [Polarella glacialis]|uniref:Uncharacterized protein n=1 Tax=Polarella glacialis TaxID=89957 RepID=A0A813KF46_POLGL|nr:unnamed protein product [Polarella glacialis]
MPNSIEPVKARGAGRSGYSRRFCPVDGTLSGRPAGPCQPTTLSLHFARLIVRLNISAPADHLCAGKWPFVDCWLNLAPVVISTAQAAGLHPVRVPPSRVQCKPEELDNNNNSKKNSLASALLTCCDLGSSSRMALPRAQTTFTSKVVVGRPGTPSAFNN